MTGLYGKSFQTKEVIQVEVTRLDDLLAEVPEVSLLKIDAQGSERVVLAGAPQTIQKTRWILVEVNFVHHYQSDVLFPELHCLLTEGGFSLANFSPPFRHDERALWADALYGRAATMPAALMPA